MSTRVAISSSLVGTGLHVCGARHVLWSNPTRNLGPLSQQYHNHFLNRRNQKYTPMLKNIFWWKPRKKNWNFSSTVSCRCSQILASCQTTWATCTGRCLCSLLPRWMWSVYRGECPKKNNGRWKISRSGLVLNVAGLDKGWLQSLRRFWYIYGINLRVGSDSRPLDGSTSICQWVSGLHNYQQKNLQKNAVYV